MFEKKGRLLPDIFCTGERRGGLFVPNLLARLLSLQTEIDLILFYTLKYRCRFLDAIRTRQTSYSGCMSGISSSSPLFSLLWCLYKLSKQLIRNTHTAMLKVLAVSSLLAVSLL